jgi:uncharacterized protein
MVLMKYRFDGYNWIIKLEQGDKLIQNLTRLAKNQNIPGAWISALGAASYIKLGFYDMQAKEYIWKEFDETLEITSLTGNISMKDGEPIVHVHGSFSDSQMQAFGGHVGELTVGATCEVFLHLWNSEALERSHDEQTGLNLLDI